VSRHTDGLSGDDVFYCFNPVLGFLSVSTFGSPSQAIGCNGFNPVLGFLSVSTNQTRLLSASERGFNPVLGFLSVSTSVLTRSTTWPFCFNPVLGFLSVSTVDKQVVDVFFDLFQSRAGFSECLDPSDHPLARVILCFNPVLGFLSVST